jgi:hypothetical protein
MPVPELSQTQGQPNVMCRLSMRQQPCMPHPPLLTCGEPSAAGGPGYEATRAGTCRAGKQTRIMADR